MIIYAEDTEEVRESKRRANLIEMANDHKRGALLLPPGIPERCKVEQPGDQIKPEWGCKTTDTQFCNGVVRNLYFDGHEKRFTALGFAGRARISRESVTVR